MLYASQINVNPQKQKQNNSEADINALHQHTEFLFTVLFLWMFILINISAHLYEEQITSSPPILTPIPHSPLDRVYLNDDESEKIGMFRAQIGVFGRRNKGVSRFDNRCQVNGFVPTVEFFPELEISTGKKICCEPTDVSCISKHGA